MFPSSKSDGGRLYRAHVSTDGFRHQTVHSQPEALTRVRFEAPHQHVMFVLANASAGPFRVSAGVCGRRYCPISRVHLLNVADDHDVDLGFVSSETEYSMSGRVPRAATFDVVIGYARGRVQAAAHALAARRAIPVLQFVSASKVSVAARPKPVANGRRSSSRTSHRGRRQATKGIVHADAGG
jgi:nucleoid-associated protein YgaU